MVAGWVAQEKEEVVGAANEAQDVGGGALVAGWVAKGECHGWMELPDCGLG